MWKEFLNWLGRAFQAIGRPFSSTNDKCEHIKNDGDGLCSHKWDFTCWLCGKHICYRHMKVINPPEIGSRIICLECNEKDE